MDNRPTAPTLPRPPRSVPRIPRSDPFWHDKTKKFAVAVTSTFILLQLLFLANLSYLSGSAFHSRDRIHNLNILMVDFDGGVIGQSLQEAAEALSAPSFPTVQRGDTARYSTTEDVYNAVYSGDYWGAIYAIEGSSDRLAAALQGGQAAVNYDTAVALEYIWDEVRYSTIQDGDIGANFQALISATRVAYTRINGTRAIKSVAIQDASAVAALLNPIAATSVNIQPTTQGSRAFYNTLAVVVCIVMQFFFCLAINGVSASFQLYSRLPMHTNGKIRLALSLSYTFCGSLVWTGWVWAFREDWHVSAGQFFLTFLTVWFYMHIQYMVIDIATKLIPMNFVPFFTYTWIVINVANSANPFELSPGFYKWGYALPTHAFWDVLFYVWSGGANNRLYRALPILFAWEVAVWPLAVYAMIKRCRDAGRAEYKEEERIRQLVEKQRTEGAALQNGKSAVSDEEADVREEEKEIRADAAIDRSQYYPSMGSPFQSTLNRFVTR